MLFILLISSQFQTASIINMSDEWYFLFLSPSLFYMTGGGERERTDDLLLAKQALSQLSYTPVLVRLIQIIGRENGGPG